jgi:hypothetical protein
MEETTDRSSILVAAMILITLATGGLEKGVNYNNILEFVFGLILIAIYHFWFGGNGNDTIPK